MRPSGLASPAEYASLGGEETTMTHSDFNHLLSSISALSHDQMRQLIGELQRKMAAMGKQSAPRPADVEESAYELASRAGLIGGIQGEPSSPTDLSANPEHMEGFGHGEPDDSERTARQLENLRRWGRTLDAMPEATQPPGKSAKRGKTALPKH